MTTEATPIVLPDLTTATVDGAGVFDTLMRAHKAHLEQEFTKGRIKGPEYATVYLGGLEAILNAAVSFLLQKDKVAAEIALTNAQKDLVEQQTANAVAEGLNIPKQGALLDAQVCEAQAQFDLLVETKLKTVEEKTLLTWKTTTEKAQTLTTGVDDNSVIGKQKNLYQAQADGFKRDAEQKAAKIFADTWNVRRTTDSATVADGTNKFDDATVGRAMQALLAGIGA